VFLQTDATSTLTTNAAEALNALDAEPADVTGMGFWQRKVVSVINATAHDQPGWHVTLTRTLCQAGSLVVILPVSPGIQAASTISARLETLIDELGRDRITIIWPTGLLEPLFAEVLGDGGASSRFRHWIVYEPQPEDGSKSRRVARGIPGIADAADAVASRDATIWTVARETSKDRPS
jgi:hypothetical protein